MKKLILFIALLIAAGLTAINAQGTWTQKADFGGTGRSSAVAFSIGDKGYLGTGTIATVTTLFKDFWEYDPAADTWTQKADFGGGKRAGAVGLSINGKGYIGTGFSGSLYGTYYNDFWEYDPVTNIWTKKADFGGVPRIEAGGFTIGDKGYIGTGFTYTIGDYYSDFWEYDPASDVWTQHTDFGGGEWADPAAFSIGNKGYMGTGWKNGLSADFYEYDPAADTWTQKADYGGGAIQYSVGLAIGNKGYIGTGFSSYGGFYEYNPDLDKWTKKADYGGGDVALASGFSIGNKGYIGTGQSFNVEGSKSFWEYTPDESTVTIPTITSFTPTSGAIGTEVTITGNGFSSTANDNIVYFGATKGTVIEASTTSLKVIVPIGATYLPITVTVNNLTAYSAQPFIVTFEGGGEAFTSNSFAAHIDFSTGTNPFTSFTGDLDGDGKADVIAGSYASAVVTIFRNTSNGGAISFAPKIELQVVGYWSSCTIGDLDGDGRPDIVAGNFNANKVSVFRNTSTVGNISFAERQDYVSGLNPQYESIGDLDGDGKPDFASVNYGSNTISVFRNTSTPGNISFDSKIDFATVTAPFTNSIGDLDGDGKPDIVVGTQNDNNHFFSVLRNISTTGNISFAAKVDYTTPFTPRGVAIGDLDGDGKADLASANFTNYEGGSVSIFRNTSTIANISFAAKVDYPTGGDGSDLPNITDLNGDGKPDIAVNNYWTSSVSVFKNTGTSGLISFDQSVLYGAGSGTHFIRCGDLDGDGLPDIEVENLFAGTISILRNQISSGPFCTIPSGLAMVNITGTSAKLNWDAVDGALGYVVRYKIIGSSEWTLKTATVNAKKIEGLTPQTNYAWQVRTFCDVVPPGLSSDWSSKQTFTTGALRLTDEQSTTLNVYPNPTDGQFKIAITLSDEETSSAIIQVINSLGQIMYNEKTSVASGMLQKEIQLNNLPAGMYLVNVIVNDQVYSAPINFQR